jgi:hypothetical protein
MLSLLKRLRKAKVVTVPDAARTESALTTVPKPDPLAAAHDALDELHQQELERRAIAQRRYDMESAAISYVAGHTMDLKALGIECHVGCDSIIYAKGPKGRQARLVFLAHQAEIGAGQDDKYPATYAYRHYRMYEPHEMGLHALSELFRWVVR